MNWLSAALTAAAIYVVDGDTIDVQGERIRLLGIDAPEIHAPRCEREAELGYAAKEQMKLLLDGLPLSIERHGTDRYGRTLANVSVAGVNVGVKLMETGLAIPWQPGRIAWLERKDHWCGEGR